MPRMLAAGNVEANERGSELYQFQTDKIASKHQTNNNNELSKVSFCDVEKLAFWQKFLFNNSKVS